MSPDLKVLIVAIACRRWETVDIIINYVKTGHEPEGIVECLSVLDDGLNVLFSLFKAEAPASTVECLIDPLPNSALYMLSVD